MFQKFVLLVTLLSVVTIMFGCDRKMESSAMDILMADGNPETDAPTIKLQLHPAYDTGFDSSDSITHLGTDDTVSLIGTLSRGVFKEGDNIYITWSDTLQDGDNSYTIVRSYKVGGLHTRGWLKVNGLDHFDIELPRSRFPEGTSYLKATYQHTSCLAGSVGEALAVTVDTANPIIMISHTSENGFNAITAIDTDHEETTWHYKQITDNDVWDSAAAAHGTVAYTEGSPLMFDDEFDNGTKIGFVVEDVAGNRSYMTSNIIQVPNP